MDFEGTFLLGSGFLSDELITTTTTANYGSIEAKYEYSQHADYQQPVSLSVASESPFFSSSESSPSSSASSNLQLSLDSSSTLHFSSPKIEDDMDTSTPLLSPPCAQPQTNVKKPNHGGRKRSIIFQQAEAEIQRKEFLERNRIAASKCRQKKKKWVKNLETNYEKLSTQNQHLRSMVLLYQDEISSLKTELLSRNGLCSCADMRTYIQQNSTSMDPRKISMQDYDMLSILSRRSLTIPMSSIAPATSSPVATNNFLTNHALLPLPLPPYLNE